MLYISDNGVILPRFLVGPQVCNEECSMVDRQSDLLLTQFCTQTACARTWDDVLEGLNCGAAVGTASMSGGRVQGAGR